MRQSHVQRWDEEWKRATPSGRRSLVYLLAVTRRIIAWKHVIFRKALFSGTNPICHACEWNCTFFSTPWVCLPIHWTVQPFRSEWHVKESIETMRYHPMCKMCEITGGLSHHQLAKFLGYKVMLLQCMFWSEIHFAVHIQLHTLTDFDYLWFYVTWTAQNRCSYLGECLIIKSSGPALASFAHYLFFGSKNRRETFANASVLGRRFHCVFFSRVGKMSITATEGWTRVTWVTWHCLAAFRGPKLSLHCNMAT